MCFRRPMRSDVEGRKARRFDTCITPLGGYTPRQ